MLLWLILLSICCIDTFTEVSSEERTMVASPDDSKTDGKANPVVKAKFNCTSNGSFSEEFGKVPVNEMQSDQRKLREVRFIDTEREMLKRLINSLLNQQEPNKSVKRFSDWMDVGNDQTAEFKPKLDIKNIPIKIPSVFGIPNVCKAKEHGNWCIEEIKSAGKKCTWQTDCYCATTVTCGPTKPFPEHRDKWCFIITPDINYGRTQLACHIQPNTYPVCSTTGYTPCGSFTPPCVRVSPNTLEPCVCPTKEYANKISCPCPGFVGEDLYSHLRKKAAELPEPLRNRCIALLDQRLYKRFVSPTVIS